MEQVKKKELRMLNKDELNSKLDELRRELMKLGTERSTGTVNKNPKNIKQIKKMVSKIITISKEKTKEVKTKA